MTASQQARAKGDTSPPVELNVTTPMELSLDKAHKERRSTVLIVVFVVLFLVAGLTVGILVTIHVRDAKTTCSTVSDKYPETALWGYVHTEVTHGPKKHFHKNAHGMLRKFVFFLAGCVFQGFF